MHLKATILTLILTAAAACISSSAATDTLSTVTDDRKDSKLIRFLSEKVSVSGYAQAGYLYDTYDMAHDGAFNKFNLYRAMIIADIKPIRHLDLYFMADVSKFKLHELFVRYRPVDAFYIRLGQYKTPFTIESNMSPSVLEIIKGAQAVQYLAGIDGSDVCFGGGAGRDLGLEVGGAFLKIGKDNRNLIEYRVGVFNGEPFNTAETNNRKDVVASLALRPVSILKLHGSVYIGEGTAKTDSPYGSFKAGETYRRDRWSAGLELKAGPVYLRSEYMEGRRIRHTDRISRKISGHSGIGGLSGPEYRPERLAVQLHLRTSVEHLPQMPSPGAVRLPAAFQGQQGHPLLAHDHHAAPSRLLMRDINSKQASAPFSESFVN